ncbi:MAG TPA: LEA type 2 family protein [Gemmatimonadaceae bacterium]|jgi:LEA14-like dessication related protein
MRRLMLGAAAAAIAVTGACSAIGRQAFQQPVVNLRDVQVQGIGLTGGNLAVKLNVYNPNGYRLDATQLRYNLVVGDDANPTRLAEGVLDSRFTVQSGDSAVVMIPVSFTYAGIGAAGRQLLNTGAVPYRVNGDVTVGTVVGNFTVPYSSTGRFSAFAGNTR